MWTALREIDPKKLDRHGRKAAELFLALREGLAVPDSFVLDSQTLASLAPHESLARDENLALGENLTRDENLTPGENLALQAAHALLASMPRVERVLLRSSSALEDQSASSAAGLFPTLACAPRPDAIATTLLELARSATSSKLHELLKLPVGETIPLAVLAQPRLELDAWCTVQGNIPSGTLIVEGWRRTVHGRQPLWLQLPLDEEAGSFSAEEDPRGLDGIISLARAALRRKRRTWLLEIGVEKGHALLLQRRPVAEAAPVLETEDPPLIDFPLFPGDESRSWRLDAEHSPTPLCPLLAGVFLEWIRGQGPQASVRLIQGRWHERVDPDSGHGTENGRPESSRKESGRKEAQREESSHKEKPGEGEQTGSATQSSPLDPHTEGVAGELAQTLARWKTQRVPHLEKKLHRLTDDFLPLTSPSAWPAFVAAWLRWQELYYDGQSQAVREKTRVLVHSLRRAGIDPSPLPETAAARRAHALDELAEVWRQSPDEELRQLALDRFLKRHGHHAPGGWDGRAVPWREDPAPLLAELERRIEDHERDTGSPDAAIPPKEHPRDGGHDEWRSLAAEALAALEDDDELLSKAYGAFREAVLELQAQLRPEAATAEILDLLPGDLSDLIPSPSDAGWRRARERGRALSRRWENSIARQNGLPASVLGEATAGETLQGSPLSSGHAEGKPRILPSAQSEGGPQRGDILVVPSVVPSDAVVFSRCGGLICENGSLLGHAAVLAREHGVPAVVLPHARKRLHQVRRLRLDGAKGTVEILLLLLLLGWGWLLPAAAGASPAPSLDRSAARIEADLRMLCKGAKRTVGTVGFEVALDATGARLRRAGLAWRTQRVRAHRWEAGALPVRLKGPEEFGPLPPLRALGRSGGILRGSFPLLDVGCGSPQELREELLLIPGHVLVMRDASPPGGKTVHRLRKVAEAADLGAAGILFVHSRGLAVQGTVAWSGRSRIPAYSLPQGQRLREALGRGEPFRLEVQDRGLLRSASIPVESFNGIADLRPKVASGETIVVSAHLDAWDLGEGALDNAAGVAVLLETARLLAARRQEIPAHGRLLRFILFTGEEWGLEGSRTYLQAARRGKEAWPALIVNLEMPEDPAGFVIHAGTSLRAPLREILLRHRAWNLSAGVQEILDLYSDHMPFVLAGVPSFTLATHRSAGAEQRVHTSQDRMETLDPRGLARCAVILAATLQILADPATPLPSRLDDPSLEALFSSQGLDLARVRERGF